MLGLKRSLPLRIAIPVITVTLSLGAFLYSFVLATISDFAKTDIENDLKAISHRIYNVCNTNYDSMLQSSPADDLTSRIITQALTLGQLEDFYRQENIQGFIYDSTERKFVLTTSLPASSNKIMVSNKTPGTVATFSEEDEDHFIFQFDFSPWNWKIGIIKNEEEYSHLIERVQQVYIYTLTLLFAVTLLLVIFLYRSIAAPVNSIIKPLQHSRRPSYRGIAVFEYLSDTIREMMISIRQSEEKFRSLVETTTDFVWEINIDGIYTYASPSIEEILGFSPEEVIGKHCTDFIAGESDNATASDFHALLQSGKPFEKVMNTCIDKTGKQIFLESSGVPVFDDKGAVTGYNGIDRDITQRLLAEKELKEYETQQQLHKLETLGTFAGGIAHDFNNLLSIISGNLSLAKTEITPNTKAIDCLNKASQTIQRAEELTGQLVTFAEGGIPNRSVCSIQSLVVDAAENGTEGSATRCTFHLSPDLSKVAVDIKQIKRAIGNIVTNAVESMKKQGIITISGENVELESGNTDILPLPTGLYVKISIKDTGVGIRAGDISKIFDPYYTTKRMGSQKGMGLGLAVSFSIIQRHGGHLLAESESGVGTTFTFFLPARKPTTEQDNSKGLEQRTVPLKIRKILLMDDEEMIRELAEMMLTHMGYESKLAQNGTEALTIYQQTMNTDSPCDLVILDLTIKEGMSGLETMRQLLKLDPKVRAIVSSGYSSDPAMIDYEKHGFIGTLPKPYELHDLETVLKRIERGE